MLSIPHLIIIFLVALIVLGPEKLPEVARTLSKAMLEINRVSGNLKDTFQQEMNQLERELSERNPAEPLPATTPVPGVAETHTEPEMETAALPEDDAAFASSPAIGETTSAESLSAESPVAAALGPRKPMQTAPAPDSTDPQDGTGDSSGKPADGHPSAA